MGASQGETFRSAIDEIDSQLIELITERMDVVLALHLWKSQNGFPLFDAERESVVIQKYIDALGEEDGRLIAEAIIGDNQEG